MRGSARVAAAVGGAVFVVGLMVAALAVEACSSGTDGVGGCSAETCHPEPHREWVPPEVYLSEGGTSQEALGVYVEQHCHEICRVDAGACAVLPGGNEYSGNVQCPDLVRHCAC